MSSIRKRVVAIIPAFNEEGRVGSVVKAVSTSGLVDAVYVVDDGSKDKTSEEARKAGAEVIRKPKNEGKAAAIQTALEKVDADIYLLLDADLIGLTKAHIEKLLRPLENEKTGMVLGRLTKGRLATNISHTLTPNITGQRAVRKELLEGLPELASFGFAVELFLNDYCKERGYELVYVELEGLSQYLKEEKSGILSGFLFRLKMYLDIAFYLLKKLSKKLNH